MSRCPLQSGASAESLGEHDSPKHALRAKHAPHGTTGTIGNKHITTYEDGYGNTTGTIGGDRINLYTDPSGTTTGTIGRRRLNCYTDRFRTTTCN
jgi:hypothetical protein